MRAVVLHSRVDAGAGPDDQDTLVQAEAVAGALRTAGHDVRCQAADLDLARVRRELLAARPDVVVNLVETLAGTGRLVHLVPALLDHLRLPYTGSPTDPLYLTSNKLVAKTWMRLHGLPVPDWSDDQHPPALGALTGDRVIVKSVWEHASVGLDDDSVLPVDAASRIREVVEARREDLGGAAFVETYVAGREFNLSLVQRPGGWQVLPAAEIRFEQFPRGKPRIVGFRAKWHHASPEYRGTVRSFAFGEEDRRLLAELDELALECCHAFRLRGYARVDFRVSREGGPFILEVNANPCLSPDTGLAAAASEAGYGYEDLVGMIVDAAVGPEPSRRRPHPRLPGAAKVPPRPPARPAGGLPRGDLQLDDGVEDVDRRAIRWIVEDDRAFSRAEIQMAMEVFDEAVRSGPRSGYHFLVARLAGELVGFTCYGPVPGTESRFDLYWIAVQRSLRGRGIGRVLLAETERRARALGATHLEVDTSGKDSYRATRRFYESMQYAREAELRDFHGPGDPRVIYGKPLSDRG